MSSSIRQLDLVKFGESSKATAKTKSKTQKRSRSRLSGTSSDDDGDGSGSSSGSGKDDGTDSDSDVQADGAAEDEEVLPSDAESTMSRTGYEENAVYEVGTFFNSPDYSCSGRC